MPTVLIETYWNVKELIILLLSKPSKGINRNILECKESKGMGLYLYSRVLIETYWNVKICGGTEWITEVVVLIETYWNVKSNTVYYITCNTSVLIETYWNVKMLITVLLQLLTLSINRNILECKANFVFIQVFHNPY